jgi:hypothetical protein
MGQVSAGVSQMRPDEPLELLQLRAVVDQDVLRDPIEFFGLVDCLADVLDDAVVHQIQRRKVRLDGVAANRIVASTCGSIISCTPMKLGPTTFQ